MNRPALNDEISVKDFKEFYWLKEELLLFCKAKGIDRTGGKIELADRIIHFLETGNTIKSTSKLKKTDSNFNWNGEVLHLQTKITDNYKNSENVRAFFIQEIGPHFRFNVEFMKWTKYNIGKTLNDAIIEWNRLYKLKKDKNYKTIIGPQFEYNKYMRAFLADNPEKSSKEAMQYWKLKRALRGTNEYEKSDLDLK